MAGQQQLFHFVEQARRRHVLEQRRQFGNGRRGLLFDRETELGGEPRGTQHAHRVLAIARDGIADQTHAPRPNVGHAADVVPDFLADRIEVERVAGEVAAQRVLGLRAEHVVGQQPAVLVGGVVACLPCAERRYLDRFRSREHVDQPEAPADDEGATKQRLDLFRRRVGRDVEILGRDAKQQVAHRAADDKGLEAGLLQLAGHVLRAARDLGPAYRMGIGAVDARFG